MIKKPVICLYILLCCSCFVTAQRDIVYLKEVTPEQGLSETKNWVLHPNREGFIFIGSLDGLNVYDGKHMEVYKAGSGSLSIKGSAVLSPFFETDRGDVCFATDEALNIFRAHTGQITSRSLRAVDGTTLYNVLHLEHDEYLWVTAKGKLYRCGITPANQSVEQELLPSFAGVRAFVHYDSLTRTSTLVTALWQINRGLEVVRFSADHSVLSRDTIFSDLKPDALPSLIAFDVIPGPDGTAWAHTNLGVLKFRIDRPREDYLLYPSPVPGVGISSITQISATQLGVLLKNGELRLFDQPTATFLPTVITFQNLDTKQRIERLGRVFMGRDSVIWLSADGFGVFHGNLNTPKFTSLFSNYELKKEEVSYLYEDPNQVVHGFTKNDCVSFTQATAVPVYRHKFPFSRAVHDESGTTWGIKRRSLFRGNMEKDTVWHSRELAPALGIYDLVNYNAVYLILATSKGIAFYDKQREVLLPTNYRDRTVKLSLDPDGRLWSANSSGNLIVWQVSDLSKPTLTAVQQLENLGMINDIRHAPKGNTTWIGTIKGLRKINRDTYADSLITEKEGLFNQNIQAILIDTSGVLWLSTNQGITRYRPDLSGRWAFRQYTARDGLSANEYEPGAALLTSDGYIWFGSINGVDVFNPYELRDIGRAPTLALKHLRVNDASWTKSATSCVLDQLQLDYRQNTLAFELAALEYTDPSRNQFKVQLEHEGSADTTLLGTQNRITYANLAPGEYTFRFTACNAEGIWQEDWYELPITISPPYYQTWWFRSLVIIAAMALMGLFLSLYYRYQLREKQLELERRERQAERERLQLETRLNLERERTRIASDFHDEIGGGLSTIRNASAVAARKEELDAVHSVLRRVSEISLELIGNMRTIIWAMDPQFDNLNDLSAHIRSYTSQFLEDNGLTHRIDIPLELPDIDMNGRTRNNLLLVVKEALHNIVKHADAKQANLKIELNHALIITITDDGKGFDAKRQKRGGRGLNNMQKRIKAIGGRIEWIPRQPQGTVITITYPIGIVD